MKKGYYKKILAPATTENITKGIINFLNNEGHFAMRIERTGIWDEAKQQFRKSGTTESVLDIYCCLAPSGRSLWIDVKKGKDRLSTGQKNFIADIKERGGFAGSAKTLVEAQSFYNNEIKPFL